MKETELSVILPCRNEEEALASCINQIKTVLKINGLRGEIIVSDSSTDDSPNIAKKLGAILVKHDKFGYGNAYLEAFKIAKGKYIFMADADGSYDFEEIPRFLEELKKGNDLVIGNRLNNLEEGSMPFMHKYLGNPILSIMMKIFFKTKINDSQCGMRAIKRSILERLNLRTTGMEFASEMIIKAIKSNLKLKELSITYKKRLGKSKLRSFSDGWRHLRFMLSYSPLFLFFIPGLSLFILGVISLIAFSFTNPRILGTNFFIHPMFVSSLITIMGYQIIFFGIFSRTYSYVHLNDKNSFLDKIYSKITLEKIILIGLLIASVGLFIFIYILLKWIDSSFGQLNEIKSSLLALTLIVIGIQTIFSSFMLSIIGIKNN